jgi:predicted DNA-binding WGR domain protein
VRLLRRVLLSFRNAAVNSDKFYCAEVYENSDGTALLRLTWGRRGTAGQTKEETCSTADYATWALDKKRADKLREGYTVDEDRSFVRLGVSLEPLAWTKVRRDTWPDVKLPKKTPPKSKPEPAAEEEPIRKIRLVD